MDGMTCCASPSTFWADFMDGTAQIGIASTKTGENMDGIGLGAHTGPVFPVENFVN